MAGSHRMWLVSGWEDPWFEEQDSAHKVAFMYLVLGPNVRPSGLFVQSLRPMAFALNTSVERIEAVMADFDRDGKVHRDEDRGLVWVVNKAAQTELAGMGPGVRTSIEKDVRQHSRSPLAALFVSRYPEYRVALPSHEDPSSDPLGVPPRVPPPVAPNLTHNQNQEPKRTSTTKPRERVPDDLWDALVAALDLEPDGITKSRRGKLNAALRDLREVGATPAEVTRRAKRYQREHPDWPFTENALASHWASLGSGKKVRPATVVEPDDDTVTVPPPPDALAAMQRLAGKGTTTKEGHR